MQPVVLASGSQYRARLLARLNIHFTSLSPDIDESVYEVEPPAELASRLARQKADRACELLALSAEGAQFDEPHSTPIIIASDQVASHGSMILGKPGTFERASAQLASMSAQDVTFFTALFMLCTRTNESFSAMDVTRVRLRELDAQSIARYVTADDPLDCAGSFKVESLGISLFEAVHTEDPTALIGLPMIKVCEGLRQFGLRVP